jgi:glycosyltransferase involved in cell wall biosynthesis
MRIVIATNALLPADREGGTAHSNFYLARALRTAGAEVRVVTTDRNGAGRLDVARDVWAEREGISTYYASTEPGAWIRSASYKAAVRYAVKESDVCIMSSVFWNYTGLAAARACELHGVPYITMPRGLLGPAALKYKGVKKRVYWFLIAKRLVERSGAVIALSQRELRDIRAARIDVQGYVVPNGAVVEELSRIDEDATVAATLTSAATDERYILFLGRLHRIKGLDILLPAFEEVTKSDPKVSLVIAGTPDASYSAELESLLARNTVRDRVRLVGNVSGAQKARLISKATVFALTSYSEALPVAVLEALSAGVPVVITPNCNLPEVAAAAAGIEVMPEVESTARGLAAILRDQQLRETMGANAKKLALESFSWDSVGKRVVQICRSVATKSRHQVNPA